MRIRKMLAASLGAATLTAAAAVLSAPSASADVGDVSIGFYTDHGQPDGTDQDVFDNLFSSQCDTNQAPSGAASASITNLTDETVTVGTSCSDTGWISVLPLGTTDIFTAPGSDIFIIAPAGA